MIVGAVVLLIFIIVLILLLTHKSSNATTQKMVIKSMKQNYLNNSPNNSFVSNMANVTVYVTDGLFNQLTVNEMLMLSTNIQIALENPVRMACINVRADKLPHNVISGALETPTPEDNMAIHVSIPSSGKFVVNTFQVDASTGIALNKSFSNIIPNTLQQSLKDAKPM